MLKTKLLIFCLLPSIVAAEIIERRLVLPATKKETKSPIVKELDFGVFDTNKHLDENITQEIIPAEKKLPESDFVATDITYIPENGLSEDNISKLSQFINQSKKVVYPDQYYLIIVNKYQKEAGYDHIFSNFFRSNSINEKRINTQVGTGRPDDNVVDFIATHEPL